MDEIAKRIQVRTWYSLSHITGPGAVWMALSFGETPDDGPRIERMLRDKQSNGEIKFDLPRYVAEVLAGVAEANTRENGSLEVEAIRVVPDDYPTLGQAKYVAFRLALRALADAREPH
ncbi:MAG TPA: hypothetical protein VEF55_10365 [Candidatus Binatia bacterium]|nr:hypothetical protein [Candidatus Binatia bacterium]